MSINREPFQPNSNLRTLEVNGGRVLLDNPIRLVLPATAEGYADAQIDDYGGRRRRDYPWQPGLRLTLKARFSHAAEALQGTAGFGFWNAPFGDPSVPWPALPRATWFFFGSPPTDLPLAPSRRMTEAGHQPGRGWFAATLNATWKQAVWMGPIAPLVVLLNRLPALRRRIWPPIQRRLGMSFAPLSHIAMQEWHQYRLDWRASGCTFFVDGRAFLQTPHSPQGPLGFVCWLDNQYMVATPHGRFRWGTIATKKEQWLEVKGLEIAKK